MEFSNRNYRNNRIFLEIEDIYETVITAFSYTQRLVRPQSGIFRAMNKKQIEPDF